MRVVKSHAAMAETAEDLAETVAVEDLAETAMVAEVDTAETVAVEDLAETVAVEDLAETVAVEDLAETVMVAEVEAVEGVLEVIVVRVDSVAIVMAVEESVLGLVSVNASVLVVDGRLEPVQLSNARNVAQLFTTKVTHALNSTLQTRLKLVVTGCVLVTRFKKNSCLKDKFTLESTLTSMTTFQPKLLVVILPNPSTSFPTPTWIPC